MNILHQNMGLWQSKRAATPKGSRIAQQEQALPHIVRAALHIGQHKRKVYAVGLAADNGLPKPQALLGVLSGGAVEYVPVGHPRREQFRVQGQLIVQPLPDK